MPSQPLDRPDPDPGPDRPDQPGPGAHPLLELDAVTVRFGSRAALDSVDLQVAAHEIVCVLGPSGSGKSTLLRAVAGLQPLDGGRILLDGADQKAVPAHRRGLGLMFQDHQLFPQRDVAGNVAFGPRMHKMARGPRDLLVAQLLDLVGLPGAGRRAVATLSGGEQQRVALARALAPEPRLLMLDEPLGQLDRSLRERLVVELRRLFGRLGTTVLAVTHDQGEAFALADRVVVMRDGRIAQSGTPLEVWQRPASEFVARFLGFDNIVDAVVDSAGDGGGQDAAVGANSVWGRLPVPGGTPAALPAADPAHRGAARAHRRRPGVRSPRPHLPRRPCRRPAATRTRPDAGGRMRAARRPRRGRAGRRHLRGRGHRRPRGTAG